MPNKSIAIQLLIILFTTLGSYAQNETKKWLFGNGAGLDFTSPSPSVMAGGAITTSLGCASIADAAGNLLFYTDGATVYNQTHTVMANGTGLFGGNVAQTSMILKKPGSTHEYYVFTQQSTGLYYSVVNMSLASGNGSVTVKNATLFTGNCAGKLTATKHCNGTDYWILAVCSDSFYAYSVTSTSVNPTPVISAIQIDSFCPLSVVPSYTTLLMTYSVGCMKLSPNGKRLFFVASSFINYSFMTYNYKESVQLYHFDNSSGGVMNGYLISASNINSFAQIVAPNFPYGCEFSPDGSKAYFSHFNASIMQFDLCQPICSMAITGVPISENSISSGTEFKRSFQLGPNGKIYIATSATSVLVPIQSATFTPTNSLGVINNPNAQIGNATYNPTGQSLGTYSCQWGLPNFPGSYFEQRPLPGFTNSSSSTSGCTNHTFYPVQVCSASGYNVMGYQWDFGDPASGTANSSFLSNPVHAFSAAGSYTVRLVRSFSCFNDTISKVINTSGFSLSISSSSAPCSPSGATVSVSGGNGPYTYSWSVGSQTNAVASISVNGTHSVTVLQPNQGCAIQATFNVNTPAVQLQLSVAANSLQCHGVNNASASMYLSGGSGSYNYTWSAAPNNNSPNINNLAAGVHSVTVNDLVNQCTVTKTFTVLQPAALNLSLSPQNPSACIGAYMMLYGFPSGGTTPYQYNWVGGSTSNSYNINPAVPGIYNYTLQVTDANNCVITGTIGTLFRPLPSIHASNINVCAGSAGVFSISGTNSYTWQPANVTGNTYTVNPLVSSIYTVTADSMGCFKTMTLSATVNPATTVSISGNNSLCEGQLLVLNGSSGLATYQWIGPNGFNSSLQNASLSSVSLINSGNYTLTASNPFSCSATAVIPVLVLPLPVVSLGSNSPLCVGQNLHLHCVGANTSILWSGPGSFLSTLANPTISTVLQSQAGIYTVTVTDANSCTNTGSIVIAVSPNPVVNLSSNSPLCVGLTLQLNGNTTNGVSYSWIGPAGFVSLSQSVTVPFSSPAQSGVYSLTVVDINSCQSTGQINVVVNPNPSVSISGNTVICQGGAITLTAQGASTYSWNTGSMASVLSLTPGASANYTVTGQLATTSCSATKSISVIVEKCTGLYELNQNQSEISISPNPSSGQFKIEAKSAVTVEVYDQLGKLIVSQQLNVGNHLIELNPNAKGLYYLNWHSGSRHGTTKLMVEP